jgi:hypothetical protein
MYNSKKKGEGDIQKSFKFKVKTDKETVELFRKAAVEYSEYYKRLTTFLCERLTDMTWGEVASFIPEKYRKNEYYKYLIKEENKDLPLYKMFTKAASSMFIDHSIERYVEALNPEGNTGNILGFCKSSYVRGGYLKNVVSNIRTKFATLKTGIKYKKFNPAEDDEETILGQTVFEMEKRGLEFKCDFEKTIKYLNEKGKTQEAERLQCLMEYFSTNTDKINEYRESLVLDDIRKFGGCNRSKSNSFSVTLEKADIKEDGLTGYTMKVSKKLKEIHLLGHRRVVEVVNGRRVNLVDICGDKSGDSKVFVVDGDNLYVCISAPVKFSKNGMEAKKYIGVDMNMKHSIISVSDNASDMKGFLNIYKELLKDEGFRKTLNATELEKYEKLAEGVNIGIIEYDGLYERIVKQKKENSVDGLKVQAEKKLIEREAAIERVLDKLRKGTSDTDTENYINYNKILRAKIKSAYILKDKYYEMLGKYDSERAGSGDLSEENKIKYKDEFNETEKGKEILGKLNNVYKDIIGCRDNIVTYAVNLFIRNGYDTVALEYLESSQMKARRIPSTGGLLKGHKLEGKPEGEVTAYLKANKIPKSYYSFEYDGNGMLTDVKYSDMGEKARGRNRFKNLVPKFLRWASIKDKFVQLSNYKDIQMVYVPSPYTSQTDSRTHSLYYIETVKVDEKTGKEKKEHIVAPKESVRTEQESFVNGMNADTNSANNIKYIFENETLRDKFLKRTKDGTEMYNRPAFDLKECYKKNSNVSVFNTLKKTLGAIYGKLDENGNFIENECNK